MADAVGRLSDSIGVLTVVPAAGLTHAASGIGEAFLDGVPMLVLSGRHRAPIPAIAISCTRWTPTSSCRPDQGDISRRQAMTKSCRRCSRHTRSRPRASRGRCSSNCRSMSCCSRTRSGSCRNLSAAPAPRVEAPAELARAAELLARATRPCIFVGWGARDATAETRQAGRMARGAGRRRPCRACRCFPPTIRCMSVSASAPLRCRRRRKPSRIATA